MGAREPDETQQQSNQSNKFDFLVGSWRVYHRRLKERLANNHDWIEFEGTCSTRKILGGAGNMDEHSLDFPGDAYRAVAIRTYDAAKRQWSIWWIDGRRPGHLDPPLVGGFKDGVGVFYSEDTFEGKRIQIRFLWTDPATRPHWEQAFSDDGGKTWETNWTMQFVKSISIAETCCPIVELRQYRLVPGQRETLIALFEREFIESQEGTGMRLIGQFRDLRNPDRFVWLRGFSDMDARAHQLEEFYGGPVWKAHRDAANATMIDSDNVLLLRPTSPTAGFQLEQVRRAPRGSTKERDAVFVATIYNVKQTPGDDLAGLFERELRPKLVEVGISVLASFVTETHPNSFPRLPVREDARVFVWFSRFDDNAICEEQLSRMLNWMRQSGMEERLSALLDKPPETLMLQATARSLLR